MKTAEINKKFAQFLDWEQYPIQNKSDGYKVVLNKGYSPIEIPAGHLKFHNDWNWLMLVVEKIEKTNKGTLIIQSKGIVDISFNGETRTFYTGNLIDNVYEACSMFVDWYDK